MIDEYLNYLQEGYFLSDKTISVNLDQFLSGKKNKLLIVGVPGSGKTSLGEYLLKKYRVKDFVTDTHWEAMYKGITSRKRTIVEGAGLAVLYMKEPKWRNLIIKQPMIIMGMSAFRAGLRADKRDGTLPFKAKSKRDIYYFVRQNLSYFQISLSRLRKDVMDLPDATVKEFHVPKFTPVYL